MQTQELLADYAACIDMLARELERAACARLDLDEAERRLMLLEAARLIAGVEGSNEGTRKANLQIALEADEDYRDLRTVAGCARTRVSAADTQVTICRERCRMLRLVLALAVSDGTREGVFA